MALTKTAPERETGDTRNKLGRPLVLALAVLVLLTAYSWNFIGDPTLTAPTRDPAWYTWRAQIVAHDNPDLIVGSWGPFGMFEGGYRVTVPATGALLERVAGIDHFTFVTILMVAFPILASLALAAFAYRHRRDPLLFLLTLLAGAGLFLTTPYVGYLDNIMVLYVLAMLLPFLEPARTSWGARSALLLFGFLSSLTHPTTAVIFGVVMTGGAGLHWLTSRFSIKKTLDADGPALMSVGFGMIAGLALWVAGIWGTVASFKEAALPPPYTQEFFTSRLGGWVTALRPEITGPLAVVAVIGVWFEARRRREPAGEYTRYSFLWLLPLLGLFGWVAGLSYPYYRFMNATLAPLLIVGMGAWFASRFFLNLDRARRPLGILGVAVVVAGLGFILWNGLGNWAKAGWVSNETRVAMASARAYVATESDQHPIIFVQNYKDSFLAWGWSKTYTNVTRASLDGDTVARSLFYFGDVEDFLAGKPSLGDNGVDDCPGDTKPEGDNIYDCVSRGFLDEMDLKYDEFTEEGKFQEAPTAFMVSEFNKDTTNADLIDSPSEPATALGPDIVLLSGPDLAPVSQEAVETARAAGEAEAARLANHEGAFADSAHLLRVAFGLIMLLVVPGLIAMRWFELEDFPVRLALIPGISLGLTLVAAVAVIAVTRGPFGAADGWISVGLATATAAGLRFGKPRLDRVLGGFSAFFNRMFATFSNASFSALMSTQFAAQAADGIVQTSLAKSIAFGGEKGFDITGAPSARYLLLVVLALYVPYTFVSPFVGAFIDRYERKQLLIRSNLFRAAVIGLVALALAAAGDGLPDAVPIIAILVALACTRILLAVKSAGLPAVLQGKDLLQGNGLSQAGGAIFQVMGGGVAFAGTAVAPAWIVALAGGFLYALAAFMARRVEHLEYERRTARFLEEIKRVFGDIARGLREVFSRPAAALGLSGFQALRMEFFGFVALVFALEARTLLSGADSDKTVVAIAGAFGAIGAAIGMVLAQKLKDRVPPYRLLVAAMTAIGAGVIAFGGITTIVGFSAITFIGALGFFVGKISADTIMQQALPDDFRGRGFSLFDIAYNLGWIVPAFVLALVWDDSRVRLILIVSGVVFLLATALVWRWAVRIREQLAPEDDVVEPEPAGR